MAAMRVLVVEDQVDLGDVFRDFLFELGHQPVVVHTAEAALAKLQTERPDAILLDVHLPGMSGIDFLQLRPVRALGVPIVAVSGVVNEAQARACLQLGAADFMGKPVQLDRLNEILTFLEPHAMSRLAERQVPDRRQSPRARLSIPLRLVEYSGRELEGYLIEVSVSGARARLGTVLEPDTVAKLVFTPPDDGPAIEAVSILVRTEPDGHAFTFVRLGVRDAERLRALVRSTSPGEPPLADHAAPS
jgi:DNA-binding response OmpR family regulator